MDLRRFRHETGGFSICYLGQVGFLLQRAGVTLVIDPYLSDSVDRLPGTPKNFWVRAYAPPFQPEELKEVDLVLCTHDHLDHVDPQTLRGIATASPNCRFFAPKLSVATMIENGLPAERIDKVNEGDVLTFHGIRIEPVASAHETYEKDEEGNQRFLGYLIHWDGVTLYHAGDTISTPELVQTLSKHRIDVGFLPINGRNEERHKLGIVGNLTSAEAVELATDLKFDLLIPTHHDLYPNNGTTLAEFVSAWEKLPASKRPHIKAFCPGERMVYKK